MMVLDPARQQQPEPRQQQRRADKAAAAEAEAPPAAPPGRGQPAAAAPACTAICADGLPLAAGFSDGRLVLWRWRRRAPGEAPTGAARAVRSFRS
jgi:hypothetical protein